MFADDGFGHQFTIDQETFVIRKLVLAALLALNLGVIVNSATAMLPLPVCLPCPDDWGD
ncbi:MAG: hypothetical protein R2762_03260 [Bryobacteraceae bacterium]